MPSAARQRLPADMWRQGHRKHSSGSPGLIYHSQDFQASPVHYDVFQEDKQHSRLGNKKNTQKVQRKFHATGRGSPKSVPRSGSADILSVAQSDSDSGSDSGSDNVKSVLSSSVTSDSCLSYKNPPQASDAYAMEAAIAPHPSQLPFPPLEWLQNSSKRSLSPAVDGMSLQAILGCIVAA